MFTISPSFSFVCTVYNMLCKIAGLGELCRIVRENNEEEQLQRCTQMDE